MRSTNASTATPWPLTPRPSAGARQCQIGVGDVVISRRNDPTIEVWAAADTRRDNVAPLTPRSATGNAGRS